MRYPTIERLCESAYGKLTTHERLAVRTQVQYGMNKALLVGAGIGAATGGIIGYVIGVS